MIKFLADEDFNNRIVRGLLRRQPEVPQSAAIGPVIDDLILIAVASEAQEFENRIAYLPL
jgi:hypothetical protein